MLPWQFLGWWSWYVQSEAVCQSRDYETPTLMLDNFLTQWSRSRHWDVINLSSSFAWVWSQLHVFVCVWGGGCTWLHAGALFLLTAHMLVGGTTRWLCCSLQRKKVITCRAWAWTVPPMGCWPHIGCNYQNGITRSYFACHHIISLPFSQYRQSRVSAYASEGTLSHYLEGHATGLSPIWFTLK